MITFFNNLNPNIALVSVNSEVNYFLPALFIFFANTLYYFVFFLKFYRILCFSKITFDGLPMINPYIWPFSIFRVLTKPYFKFWSRILPSFKSGKSTFDISLILGLEGLSAAIYCFSHFRLILLIEAANLLAKISI
jgi:hypothetical protein